MVPHDSEDFTGRGLPSRTRRKFLKQATGFAAGAVAASEFPFGMPSDPPRMFKAIQSTRKPCLVYKVLAAGRKVDNSKAVQQAFRTAFDNIKPIDAVIVGMYQEFSDQVGENAAIVRELAARAGV